MRAVIAPTDRPQTLVVGDVSGTRSPTLSGTTADLVRWVTGRGARRLSLDGRTVEDADALPRVPCWF